MKMGGATCSRTQRDSRTWRAWMEGYILQWMANNGGLHPAVDGQQWGATSCSGWLTMEGYILQWMANNGGLHPAVDR